MAERGARLEAVRHQLNIEQEEKGPTNTRRRRITIIENLINDPPEADDAIKIITKEDDVGEVTIRGLTFRDAIGMMRLEQEIRQPIWFLETFLCHRVRFPEIPQVPDAPDQIDNVILILGDWEGPTLITK